MSLLRSDLMTISAELRSGKVQTRHKAAEQLDRVLKDSKNEIVELFCNQTNDFSCSELFTSVIDAVIAHSDKIEEARNEKSAQTLRNKNFVYRAIITNLIDYSLEDEKNFLSKSCIFGAFTDGLRYRNVVANFGPTFVDLLERGIYRSSILIRQLKVNEYSRILSHLFEVNVNNDDIMRFSALTAIIRTIQLAVDHVQIESDLFVYLPELIPFARKANTEQRRADVIKLFYLFVSQLTIDYHESMCGVLQEQIPIIIKFYQHPMKANIKETFFHSIYLALLTLYPHLISSSFEVCLVEKVETWPSTLDNLYKIIVKEAKEYKTTPYFLRKTIDQEWFVKMAACVTYLKLWATETLSNSDCLPESRKKIKHADKLDDILGLMQGSNSNHIDVVWLAILTELFGSYPSIINASNISQALQSCILLLQTLTNSQDFSYLRRYIASLLHTEKELISTNKISFDYCIKIWDELVQILKSNCATNLDIVAQQQLLLRDMITYKKVSTEDCVGFLESFINNAPLKRNECIQTVQKILVNAESIGLHKDVEIVERLIVWLYGENEKVRMQHMLLNVAPINKTMIANTAVYAVINFLNQSQSLSSTEEMKTETKYEFNLLLYKRNKNLICLRECKRTPRTSMCQFKVHENDKSTCLFQNNYNLLMRTLNFEPTSDMTVPNILTDLSSLEKIALVMKAFIDQDVFNIENFTQCPLIKRMGVFLDHLEFQLKSVDPRNFSDIVEIMQQLNATLDVFISNSLLLHRLDLHSLDTVLSFVGTSLKCCANNMDFEFDDWQCMKYLCLKILSKICGSSKHYTQAFINIKTYQLKFPDDANILLDLIEIFCKQEVYRAEIAYWFVEHLKHFFTTYHTDINIMEKVIVNTIMDCDPIMINLQSPMNLEYHEERQFQESNAIVFKYIQDFDDALQSMFAALGSLLKISYKKSYSTKLTILIIECVKHIAQSSNGIFFRPEFTSICLAVAKFLTASSIKIQFATLEAISSFICEDSTKSLMGDHNLCQMLFSQFEWKNLPTETIDLKQNAIAITTQFLVTFFTFSLHFKENAIQDLMFFCALRKIKETELQAFKKIENYCDCSLSDLCKPFIGNLLHSWTTRRYPILKFPYFLCSNNQDDFFADNLSEILSCLLLYGKADDLKPLKKYVTKDSIYSALPIVHSYILPSEINCREAAISEYGQHIKNLKANLHTMGLKLPKNGDAHSLNWETILFVISHLNDENHFQEIYGYSVNSLCKKWFGISIESIKRCLNLYINGNYSNSCQPFETIMKDNSLQLLYILNELQKNCLDCIFVWEKSKYFCIYCTMVDLIIDSIPASEKTARVSLEHSRFLVRDALFFILSYVRKGKHLATKKYGLSFLNTLLRKPQIITGYYVNVIALYLNDFCKNLVTIAEESNSLDIEQISINIITFLIVENITKFNEIIVLLDEFPAKDSYSELRECQSQLHVSDCNSNEVSTPLKSFLSAKNRGVLGIKALRQYIRKHKSFLQNEDNILYELINQLIATVRHSDILKLQNEAALCLGDIGSLKIRNASYYFHTEHSIYENEAQNIDSSKYFYITLFEVIDKIVLDFNPSTYRFVRIVAEKLTNSVHGKALLDTNTYFTIFKKAEDRNYLDFLSNCSPISWISIFKSTEQCNNYNKWICEFMSNAYKECVWEAFHELSFKNVKFADVSFLPFIRLLISENKQHLQSILDMLQYFFGEFSKSRNLPSCSRVFRDKRIIRKFLDICECIRVNNNWTLELNLINVCEACNYCQAYFMSIMYLELWHMQNETRSENKTKNILENNEFQNAAIKAYQSIGCTDAVESFLNPYKSRIDFLNLRNDWSDILLETTSNETVTPDLYSSILKRNGILLFGQTTKNQKQIDYEICWRLCQWDANVDDCAQVNGLNDMEQEFQKHHFNALKCLNNKEEKNTLAAISNARQCVLAILNEISIECLQSVYKYLTWLQLLRQVEDFCEAQFYSGANLQEIFDKWKVDSELDYGNFRYKEEILSHQITLFYTGGIRTNRKILEIYKVDPIEMCLLNCVNICKNAGEINLAKRNIARLRNMKNISNKLIKINMLLEDAEICFNTEKTDITKSILEHALYSEELRCLYIVRAIRMYGEYLLETNNRTFEQTLKTSFNSGMNLLDKYCKNKQEILSDNVGFLDAKKFDTFESENRKQIYQTIAKYADREYIQFNTYINSEEFQTKLKIIQQNRVTADAVSKQTKDRDKTVGANFLKKNATLDEREMQSFQTKCNRNLCIAVENYIRYCSIDNSASESIIYRIIGLWFSNKQNGELHTKIEENISLVPSYKFIGALNQITGHLNSKYQSFIKIVKKILIQCVQEHSHQTLYKLLPLVFAFNDGTGNETNNRVEIAKEIISKGKTQSNLNTIQQLEKVFPALIDFANFEVGGSAKSKTIALSEKMKKLKNLNAIHCPTINLPANSSQQYNIISVVKWSSTVSLVGGINAPKKLMCLCSDGITRPQLLKGKDDLRQDAVMQQVFGIINNLLGSEPETANNKLMVRTYSVVPLSMRSGILEWCENTIPIGMYLMKAHEKYRPDDYSIPKCRSYSMQHLKSDTSKRLEMYKHICEHIQPVMHFFLLEKFLVPGIWFERRLAYTNSVATNSIVGFILGLGDRHTQNILIDEKTAELIHIDFGIAFEQGKIMPTPETVPFRLTRDIISPMGVCKSDGIFKKSCEATMKTMRRHRVVIITILEVLLYDPLYMWKVLQQKTSAPEEVDSSEETNSTAQRTLLCVRNKLEGKQAGILSTLEVGVQVQRLINDASSIHNLCQLYPGWDPYL